MRAARHPVLGRAGRPRLGRRRTSCRRPNSPACWASTRTRVMTPRGSTAVTGLELMTALRPPTRAVQDPATGKLGVRATTPARWARSRWTRRRREAPDGHPLVADLPRFHQRGPAEELYEEAYDWARPLTDEECTLPLRWSASTSTWPSPPAANRPDRRPVAPPTTSTRPAFDPKLPGSWLVDLSHVEPATPAPAHRPFTPNGEPPRRARPGTRRPPSPTPWSSATTSPRSRRTCATRHGRYLDAWYNRLRDAYVATMADLGVTAGPGRPASSWRRWTATSRRDPAAGVVARRDQGHRQGRHRQAARAPARRRLAAGRAVAGPGPADLAPRHPRRRHLQAPGSTCTARCVKHRDGHRPVPGRGPLRLRRLPLRRPEPAGLPALRRTASRCPAASGSASTRAWSSTRAPRRAVGRGRPRGARPGLNPARHIKDGDVTARTKESRHAMGMLGDASTRRAAGHFTRPAQVGPARRCGTWSSSTRAPRPSPSCSASPSAPSSATSRTSQAAPPGPRRPAGRRGHASGGSPRSAPRPKKQAATTGGIVIDTRARFGYTAAARHHRRRPAPPPHRPCRPQYAARLFDAHARRRRRPAAARTSPPKDSRRSTSRTAAAAPRPAGGLHRHRLPRRRLLNGAVLLPRAPAS